MDFDTYLDNQDEERVAPYGRCPDCGEPLTLEDQEESWKVCQDCRGEE